MSEHWFIWFSPVWLLLRFLTVQFYAFWYIWNVFSFYISTYFFFCITLSFPDIPKAWMLDLLLLFYRSLRYVHLPLKFSSSLFRLDKFSCSSSFCYWAHLVIFKISVIIFSVITFQFVSSFISLLCWDFLSLYSFQECLLSFIETYFITRASNYFLDNSNICVMSSQHLVSIDCLFNRQLVVEIFFGFSCAENFWLVSWTYLIVCCGVLYLVLILRRNIYLF